MRIYKVLSSLEFLDSLYLIWLLIRWKFRKNLKAFNHVALPRISDGEAYCMGSPETDCWYLYTLIRDKPLQDPPEPDQTLEILMTQLDPDVMSIFTRDVCSSADEATVKSGIDKLIPNMIIDDFLFEPCGYSMNGVSKNVSRAWK